MSCSAKANEQKHRPLDASEPEIAAVRRFLPQAGRPSVKPLGQGLINRTWLVEQDGQRYVLQQINADVFPDVEAIAFNLLRLERWLGSQPATGIRLPRLIADTGGAAIVHDADGRAWRMLEYIDRSRVLTALTRPEQARAVGNVLGRFHSAFAELDPSELKLTLPDLHDTPGYRSKLAAALETPTRPVCEDVLAALAQIDSRADRLPALHQALEGGLLSLRVTHGDPKLDNVLFAEHADDALCLIDLDTVQPGLLHHDIADCLRSCCNRAGEDRSGDGSEAGRIAFDLAIARALMSGYAQAAGSLFDTRSSELLMLAIGLIPLELAMRFLTDHLQGDRYFRVTHPRQNLIKAKRQLALVADIDAKADAIQAIITDSFSAARPSIGR